MEINTEIKTDEISSDQHIEQIANGFQYMDKTINKELAMQTRRYFNFSITGEYLYQFIDKLSSLVDEAKITIDKYCWFCRAVDPSHTAMLELKLSNDKFDSYAIAPIDLEIGLDVAKIHNFLKIMGKKAMKSTVLEIAIDTEKRKISYQFGHVEYTTCLLSTVGMEYPKYPTLSLPVNMIITDVKPLIQYLKMIKKLSDHVVFKIESIDQLILEASGDTDDSNKIITGTNDYIDEPVRSVFPAEYLLNTIKTLTKERIEIDLGQDYPIRINSLDTESKFLIAPRIESGE